MRTAAAAILLTALLDLNTATLAELDRLPGIGPVIAGRILEFREKRRGFRRVEELLAIPGISERIWQELVSLVAVGGAGAPESESEEVREDPAHAADDPAEERPRQ
jgi:competence ComEA-like helix-hairpin-helix protein